jgi:multidrug efflux pump subunit AcrA (membrane-fusion protein)
MRYKALMLLLSGIYGLVFVPGCRNTQVSEENAVRSVVPVTVTVARTGKMAEYTELTATSSFLVKAVVKSPVTGYVEKCVFSPGDKAGRNQILFQLRTKESAALQQDSIYSPVINGVVQVRASIDGVVSVIDHPRGDFVQEGDPLCTLVLPESLVFLLEAPFELKQYIRSGNECILVLPGNEQLKAMIRSVLPSMSGASQTQRVILQPHSISGLPENLIARVKIVKSVKNSAVILPKSSVLSDEVMKHFWVMKMINDTVAVKVPVGTGIINSDSIEIVDPVFGPADRFLTSGNYGLGDTVVVRIIRHE